jgi:hypothetical protein
MKIIYYTFLVLFFLFTFSPLWPQEGVAPLSANSLLLNKIPKPVIHQRTSLTALRFNTKSTSFPSLHQSMGVSATTNLPLAYCAADLAFFCRLEVQMEKATKIPVRFRLGDVQQVDYLEGKYEGWRYGY